MVRVRGLEPPRLAALEPKSSASTNSATPAKGTRWPGWGCIYIKKESQSKPSWEILTE